MRTEDLQWWDLGDKGLASVPAADPIDHAGLALGGVGLLLAAAGLGVGAVRRRR